MFKYDWTIEDREAQLLRLRDEESLGYTDIARILGTTVSSVKHKYVRLNQAANENKHHHPVEKIAQIRRVLPNGCLTILETNAGYGNLTAVYNEYGEVTAHEIDAKKVAHLAAQHWADVASIKCDSFIELSRYVWLGMYWDVIDLDPYGFPSRYFPNALNLIKDGWLFVTFPKMGVQQINKIMKEHYRVFWGIALDDKETYEEKVHQKLEDYGVQTGRRVTLIDSIDLGRVHRFAYRVVKTSMLDIVGLKVKGKNY